MFLVKKEVGNQNFRSISLKLTELWHQYACPYMGAHAKFDFLIAPDWPNYNSFWWNLFYMINRHKLHIIVEQELCIYQTVDLRTKKAQNLTKLRLSQNGNIEKLRMGKFKLLSPRFFKFFSRMFLQLMHKTCAMLRSELDFWFRPLFPFYSRGSEK